MFAKFVNDTPFAVSVLGWHENTRRGVRVGSGEEMNVRSDMAGWTVDTWSKTTTEEHFEWKNYLSCNPPASIAEFFGEDGSSPMCCTNMNIKKEVENGLTFTLSLHFEKMTKPAVRTEYIE
jgi:hypothetical protein